MKTKVLLTFPPELTEHPITYELVKTFDLRINILKASIGYNEEGMLLLELDGTGENVPAGIEFLKGIGIKVDLYNTKIHWREEECVHCGACTSVCPSGALSMNTTTWLMNYNDIKCLGCNLCLNSCPLRVFVAPTR